MPTVKLVKKTVKDKYNRFKKIAISKIYLIKYEKIDIPSPENLEN